MSHRVMFAYRWWPEISLIDENLLGIPASFAGYTRGDTANEVIQIVHVHT